MDDTKQIPTAINSLYVIPNLHANHFDMNKKRKLPAEQLGLPIPKHKHRSESFRSEHVFARGGRFETGLVNTHSMNGNIDGMCFDEGSEPESAKDSNSFNEETDSAASVSGVAKFESNQDMVCTYDSSSTQSISFGGISSESTRFHHSSTTLESSSTSQDIMVGSEETVFPVHDVEDDLRLLESGNHEEYSCAEYKVNSDEQYTEQELEELLYSNGVNPNMYVLSSGRWNVNQEAQSEARNPTIDQEFEQYFSMLML